MKTVFIADIHGNYRALESVLEHLSEQGGSASEDRVICLGDVVGYGPEPGRCIDRLDDLDVSCVMGNHDAAVVGEISEEWFNRMARAAVSWTRDRLGQKQVDFLASLPRRMETDDFECVHGSPADPLTEYVMDPVGAGTAIRSADRSAVAVGHTHVPAFFRGNSNPSSFSAEQVLPGREKELELSTESVVLNPGSVGQPRDGRPESSYALLDHEREVVTWHRVSYDVEATQQLIREAGLPERLASRLAVGS